MLKRKIVATMTASEPAPTRTTSPSASVAPKRTMARRSSRLSVYSTPGVWTAGRPAVLRMATPAARASTGAPISGMRRPSIHAAVAMSATAATPGRSAPARARNRPALAVAAPSLTAATRQAPQVFGGVHVLPAILERDGHAVLRVGLDHRARPRVSLQSEQFQVEGGVEEHRYPHRHTVRGGDDAFTFLQVCVDQPVDDLRGDAWLGGPGGLLEQGAGAPLGAPPPPPHPPGGAMARPRPRLAAASECRPPAAPA